MLKRTLVFSTLALALSSGMVLAVDPAASPAQEQVYGSELMTRAERAEHRAKLRAAGSAEEKAQVRAELHERMQTRAEQLGMRMPDTPPVVGGGMGPGGGAGRGGGMGAGRNR